MENDKYYTPEIEEFHVGFEYEYRGFLAGDWENITTEQEDFSIMFDDFEHEMDGKFNELYRVKKLDNEDIESLGWRPEHIIDVFSGDGNELVHGFSKTINETDSYCLIYTNHVLQIYLQHVYNLASGNWSQQIKFEGTIKNKSELRRLMKQLGINI